MIDVEKLDLARGARQAKHGRIGFSLQQINAVDDHAEVLYSECLGRLIEPDGTIRTSEELLAIPGASGIAPDLDRHLFELALEWLPSHPSHALGCKISAATLADQRTSAALYDLLLKHSAVARRMVLEVTGSLAANAHSAALLKGARALGYRIAMEAFGPGHATACSLLSTPVDIVKIDGSMALHGAAKLGPVVARASRAAPVVVIEGIETYAQLEAAKVAGATHLQGFLLSEPTLPPVFSQRFTSFAEGRDLRRERHSDRRLQRSVVSVQAQGLCAAHLDLGK
ncbi:EAL domain-containing protein (putative c-di-GMP-specific phosphodiesterase class I) [Sinorhizobium kostiense]|uniref:EAL domain-containing protein (Putative c-di-GMP-specific phosphodiesterase class I) n=1 Tax=Sinorhizobium kostiense TaxID=76747 RepID=A0ABS4QTT5_9HYPH|nr:EAL domain-containing protein [Sinorhizobium kostiense]MBP2234070.1 EAL domain-containing protein (putative c-di-GMP-specific phosphodiesterase class I) [Sinorhizobium kostiense]